ncbi:MAG: DsrE family protein [Pleomorphochaeta sp.]
MEKLNILWTSGDKDTFLNMVAMYSKNAIKNSWWEKINILIWGGSTKLAANDTQVLNEIKNLIEIGINIEACKACADKINASSVLENAGISVRYTGIALTEYIKGKDHLLTV